VEHLLQHLRDCVTHPWESVDMALSLHTPRAMGDPADEGSSAWHIRHTLETFCLHVRHATSGEVETTDAGTAGGSGEARDALIAGVERFCAWAAIQDPSRPVTYDTEMTLARMLGVMTRHITWHAAAAHYRCAR
jgi:hypothetical protein